jgi:hypothetical protein
MRTKTLLIAAAALVAGIVSSEAQVYSANVVGYVSIPFTNGVLALVAPALDLDGTGTNNTVSSVFTTPAIGDTVFAFNGSGYDTISYTYVVVSGHGATAVYATNWFNGSSIATNYPINPGRGVFYLPATNETATMVGTVLQGTFTNRYFPTAGNLSLVSSQIPEAAGITSVLGYKPSIGDNVFTFVNGGYNTYSYTFVVVSGHGATAVYATNWFNGSVQGEPVIGVGQGFWIQPANNTNWVQSFTVQ